MNKVEKNFNEAEYASNHYKSSLEKRVNKDEFKVVYVPSVNQKALSYGFSLVPEELKKEVIMNSNKILNYVWPKKKFFILLGTHKPEIKNITNINKDIVIKSNKNLFYMRDPKDEQNNNNLIYHDSYFAVVDNNILKTIVPYPLDYNFKNSKSSTKPDIVIYDLDKFISDNNLKIDTINSIKIDSTGNILSKSKEELDIIKKRNLICNKVDLLINSSYVNRYFKGIKFKTLSYLCNDYLIVKGKLNFNGEEFNGSVIFKNRVPDLEFINNFGDNLDKKYNEELNKFEEYFRDYFRELSIYEKNNN